MDKSELLKLRPVKQEDIPFIFSTWLKGLYYGGDKFFRKIPKEVFMFNYHQVLEKLVTAKGTVINVACLKDDEDVVVAYSVCRSAGDQNVVDWVYVKRDWRGIGLSKDLLPKEVYAVTHLTRAGEVIAAKSYPKTIFNPFIIP